MIESRSMEQKGAPGIEDSDTRCQKIGKVVSESTAADVLAVKTTLRSADVCLLPRFPDSSEGADCLGSSAR